MRLGLAMLWAAAAGMGAAAQELPADSPLNVPAKSWAVACTKNEEAVILHPGSYLRYRQHQVDEKGEQMRDEIETPKGTVARTIGRDGRLLTPEQDAAERSRLKAMLGAPDDFERHVRREDQNRQKGLALLRLMPDAMTWSYVPGQPQRPDHRAGDPPLVVLDFKPDPKWSAPSLEAEVLTGLEGRAWIDPRAQYVVHLEGRVTHAINIGWGLVAHIYPGGTVVLHQTNAGGQRWIVSSVDLRLTVRALLVKTVKQQTTFETADYREVPAMSYQDAVRMLLETPLPTR
ncbi:MAG TPA: hypothetical protein VG714_03940 [Acidobacteriaceae bacterium]|nr:hypothetical protein [Acidobacteriaceae bacterium]